LIVLLDDVDPVPLLPPQAARIKASTKLADRASKRTGGFLMNPPVKVTCTPEPLDSGRL
jgi:hypothetical protein